MEGLWVCLFEGISSLLCCSGAILRGEFIMTYCHLDSRGSILKKEMKTDSTSICIASHYVYLTLGS